MSSTVWQEVKHKIETTLDEIYLDMPLEVQKVQAGILPYNASHHGQHLSSLQSLMMTLMGWNFYSGEIIMPTIDDESFTLAQCHKLIIAGNRNPARYTGYIAYPTVWQLWTDVEKALPSVQTKANLKELMTQWFSYVNRMHFWNAQIYPWHLAKHVQTNESAEIGGQTYYTGRISVPEH